MGFEAFQVVLHGGSATAEELSTFLINELNAVIDTGLTPDWKCFALDDGYHVFEFEIRPDPVSISCRFALCQPSTVDQALLELIRTLMVKFDMGLDATLNGGRGTLLISQFQQIRDTVLQDITGERKLWIAQCGKATLKASTAEAFEKVIQPTCVTVSNPLPQVA